MNKIKQITMYSICTLLVACGSYKEADKEIMISIDTKKVYRLTSDWKGKYTLEKMDTVPVKDTFRLVWNRCY